MRKLSSISTLSLILFLNISPAHCGEEKVNLEAKIEKQEVTLQTIRDLRLDIKRVRSASAAIFDEVTREPVDYTIAPNVVGSTIINPITIKETGVLEPRKEWIKHSLDTMRPTIALLKQDVESIEKNERELALSENVEKELDVHRADWVILVKNISKEFNDLVKLTASEPCNNLAIASHSRKIYLMSKRLEKTRKRAEKLLMKELKQRKKTERKVSRQK